MLDKQFDLRDEMDFWVFALLPSCTGSDGLKKRHCIVTSGPESRPDIGTDYESDKVIFVFIRPTALENSVNDLPPDPLGNSLLKSDYKVLIANDNSPPSLPRLFSLLYILISGAPAASDVHETSAQMTFLRCRSKQTPPPPP